MLDEYRIPVYTVVLPCSSTGPGLMPMAFSGDGVLWGFGQLTEKYSAPAEQSEAAAVPCGLVLKLALF